MDLGEGTTGTDPSYPFSIHFLCPDPSLEPSFLLLIDRPKGGGGGQADARIDGVVFAR